MENAKVSGSVLETAEAVEKVAKREFPRQARDKLAIPGALRKSVTLREGWFSLFSAS